MDSHETEMIYQCMKGYDVDGKNYFMNDKMHQMAFNLHQNANNFRQFIFQKKERTRNVCKKRKNYAVIKNLKKPKQ
jgi:hypothetical protein